MSDADGNVQVYDRPASADRPPILQIAIVIIAIVASIAAGLWFFVFREDDEVQETVPEPSTLWIAPATEQMAA